MAFDSRVYRILIASPSDVFEERETAVRVMQDWNDLNSNNRRVVVLPLRWETHTAPEYNVRPQEAINRRIVDDCDLIVGVFWTKLGTPTGIADSGTLEEIERVAKAGKPVMLYFSHVPMDPNKVDISQMDRLRRFKETVLSNALIESFGSSLEFRDKFASQLELKIRDLQNADLTGAPSPLELQFLSLETGSLTGNSLSTTVEVLELSDGNLEGDDEFKRCVDLVFRQARAEAAAVPVVLAINNIGSSGIRNLYVEMSIKTLDGEFQVSDSSPFRPSRRNWAHSGVYYFSSDESEPTEIERKLNKLSGSGLSKDGDEWKFNFEWDALQPQRLRLVEPVTYVEASTAFKAQFSAKVFADSFASPVVLHAELNIDASSRVIQSDSIAEKAKKMASKPKGHRIVLG